MGYCLSHPVFLEITVSLQELETAITKLPAEELTAFARWFEEYLADVWDRRIEADIKGGRLDQLAEEALRDLSEGRCNHNDVLRTVLRRDR